MPPKTALLLQRLNSLQPDDLTDDDRDLLDDFKDEIKEIMGLLAEAAVHVEADRILEPDAARYRRRDLCIRLRRYIH